jgi:hypothetical protein
MSITGEHLDRLSNSNILRDTGTNEAADDINSAVKPWLIQVAVEFAGERGFFDYDEAGSPALSKGFSTLFN